MKNLRLNLKAKWYNMIESGVKKEEYREIKPYWQNRLLFCPEQESFPKTTHSVKLIKTFIDDGYFYVKKYDTITFVYGYTKRQMTFKCNGIQIKTGNTMWGAEPQKEYFVISIGDRIN